MLPQVPLGGLHRRAAGLQARVDPHLAVTDLLQPVHAQVAHAGRGGVLGQVVGRAARDQGHGREPLGQGAEQLNHALQGPGRLGVGHDRAQGAVEVEAERHLVGPGGQPGCVLGSRGAGGTWPGHGRRSKKN